MVVLVPVLLWQHGLTWGVLVGVGGGFNRCGNMNDGLMDSWKND